MKLLMSALTVNICRSSKRIRKPWPPQKLSVPPSAENLAIHMPMYFRLRRTSIT
ncbi:hypothetical protein EVA_02961 [gut metagenome]|uniref:Uncharacterized protein n=1 Tax=gut metagenome TaxID=749906 RepID=J9GMX5_9ZZZZ